MTKQTYDDVTHVGTSWRRVLNKVAEIDFERRATLGGRDATAGVDSLHIQAEVTVETFARWKVLRDEEVSIQDVSEELATLVFSTLYVMEILGVDPTMALTYHLDRMAGQREAGRGSVF